MLHSTHWYIYRRFNATYRSHLQDSPRNILLKLFDPRRWNWQVVLEHWFITTNLDCVNIPEELRSQDNEKIAMCMENNDLQTIYFFNSHVIHIRPTLSASYWIKISHFFPEVSYCNEVSVSIITCHKLRQSISYKYFPGLVFSGVNDNSNPKIIFRGTIISVKIALQLPHHRFVKKTQWTPKMWYVRTYSAFYVYWTDSWIKIDQLDVTCFIISLFTAQLVLNVSTSIFRSLQIIVDLFHVLYCCKQDVLL